MTLEVWHLWSVGGLLLLAVEIFTAGFIIGIFGLACLAAAVPAFLGAGYAVQWLVFAIATLVAAFGLRPFILKYGFGLEHSAHTNVDALIGREGTVIESSGRTGRVKIGGEDWLAESVNGRDLSLGEKVVVRAVDGCKVRVEYGKE